jgi:hypothetical protein
MIPVATSVELITPCCWRSTIHDVVRTRSEVQNGRRTKIIRRLE